MMSIVLFLLYAIAGVAVIAVGLFAFLAIARYRRRPKSRKGRLKPLERRLLGVVVEVTDPAISERLKRQIELLRVHCRLHFDKSMTLELYPEKKDWPRLDASDVAFPNKCEFRLATISFESRGGRFKAELGAVSGHLFDVVIRPNPKRVLSSADIKVTRSTRGRVDPMEASERVSSEVFGEVPEFAGFLADWARRFEVADVHKPLDAATAERLLSRIDANLPPDYLELMRQGDGLCVGGFRILGLSQVYSVALGSHNYYCLADDGMDVIAVRENTGHLYRCALGDESPERADGSFRHVIEESLAAT